MFITCVLWPTALRYLYVIITRIMSVFYFPPNVTALFGRDIITPFSGKGSDVAGSYHAQIFWLDDAKLAASRWL